MHRLSRSEANVIDVLLGMLVVLLIGLAVAVGVAFHNAGQIDDNTTLIRKACTSSLVVRDAMVGVLVDAQERTRDSPPETLTEQRRQDADAFYAKAIARMRAVSCQH